MTYFAFDVDGITLESHPLLVDEVNYVMETNLTVEEWSDYDITKRVGMKEDEFVRIYQKILDRTDIPLQPYAGRMLISIYQHDRQFLKFVTARNGRWVRSAERNLICELSKVEHPDGSGTLLPRPELMVFNGTGSNPYTGSKAEFLLDNDIRFFMEDNPKHWQEYMDNHITIGTFPFAWCRAAIEELKPKYGPKLQVFDTWLEAGDFILQHIIDGVLP